MSTELGAVQALPQFLLGEYELAAFAALREVEIRVREISGAPESLIGVKLMQEAFKLDDGALYDPNLDRGEAEAMMALFRGAIGVFKNPSSHRAVDYGSDPVQAARSSYSQTCFFDCSTRPSGGSKLPTPRKARRPTVRDGGTNVVIAFLPCRERGPTP